ncbi:hypothetical protein C8J30_11720 [Rhodobacter viridis]|uniref:Uncharacterized protein n=1 Tax=Rhodobacter viridis TaxID=1054202 RepID=A0A318U699_9RHOB|nr:hypothetical protein [Rhodobacter viridis]PYF07469.1 hypothetical protein C8J30_11720 [Rhodobacter viridis]
MAHDFCVLAAPLPVLRPLLAGGLFPCRFADYCAEPSFSPRKQAAVAAIGQKYNGLALSARG